MKTIVAIDGFAASGKGCLCKKLSEHFNFLYVDSGSIYRAIACIKIGMQGSSDKDLLIENIKIFTENNDDYVSIINVINMIPNHILRSEEVGYEASKVGNIQEVRDIVNNGLRNLANTCDSNYNGIVVDGRDIGTVVFPQASYKFFITANPEIRAQRRFNILKNINPNITLESILNDMKKRDHYDMSRKVAPLKKDKEYIIIDTSDDSIEESFNKLISFIK